MGFWVVRRTKRLWTDEEKRSICLQTTAPDVSVAQVARRYALNANMIFKWLRDARYAPGSTQGALDAPATVTHMGFAYLLRLGSRPFCPARRDRKWQRDVSDLGTSHARRIGTPQSTSIASTTLRFQTGRRAFGG